MGTIVIRKRGDGTVAYRAQILRKQAGKIVHRESETFDRKQAARAWLDARETELRKPGALTRARKDPSLRDVIDQYIKESSKIGRTKAQVLRTIKDEFAIADLRCSKVTSTEVVAFAQELIAVRGVKPQTVGNYLSHLGAVFTIARPAWGYPLDDKAMDDAFLVAKKLGITRKSDQRERRPTLDELEKLMNHFGTIQARRPSSAPMQKIIAFAIFSTRRLEEITRIQHSDYEPALAGQPARVLVRDMKHPGDKRGNNTWCDLPPEAAAIIEAMPKGKLVFPHTTDAIGAAFTRACLVLGINTEDMPDDERLHFHDLRHDGVSRLFEMGWNVPKVAAVSGHRSWSSLKRYTHLRQTGDKYAGWKWAAP
ncbi:tyrosine recombinase XerC [Bradyrhizobium sp. SZCCHNRI3042]|uniref:site-specific integrase n=1 Tax=Bradyrhizobium sp. SZCCHNRI3042 TaxID=3057291 RepID=UPI0029167A56|nr:tyrosine-type recombinase/integrase [Bradyrhizobium sp. SZCCHNRI3042]